MPLSRTLSVRGSVPTSISICRSDASTSRSLFRNASSRSLSSASLALETNSRRNESLLEYTEWTSKSSSCRASARNSNCSTCAVMRFRSIRKRSTTDTGKDNTQRVPSQRRGQRELQSESIAASRLQQSRSAQTSRSTAHMRRCPVRSASPHHSKYGYHELPSVSQRPVEQSSQERLGLAGRADGWRG